MSELIELEIITPLGLIYQARVNSVTLPGSEGEFGVLKGHAALVSSLKSGVIDIETKDLEHKLVAIDSGYAKVDEDKICVLVKSAILLNASHDSQIQKNIEEAKNLLKSASSDSVALASTFSKLDQL